MELRESTTKHIEALKASPGRVLYGSRGSGKTFALMQIIHDEHAGRAVLITLNQDIGFSFCREYRQMFPDDADPVVVSERLSYQLRGTNRPVYTDEVRPDENIYRLINYRGGFIS